MTASVSRAFKKTMFEYDLVAIRLAEAADVTPNQITNLKQGKNIKIATFERILAALPDDARCYFLHQLAGDEHPKAS